MQHEQPAIELSLPREAEMGRCRLCGAVEEVEFLGVYCGRCDKIAGDGWAGLALESGMKEGTV